MFKQDQYNTQLKQLNLEEPMKSILLKETFNVSPEILYNAWLDSKEHTEMTGGQAVCSSETNGNFSAWDGYITGFNISLEPHKKIVQSWRT